MNRFLAAFFAVLSFKVQASQMGQLRWLGRLGLQVITRACILVKLANLGGNYRLSAR